MPNLLTQAVQRGQWIVFGGADQGDLAPKYVTIGDVVKPVYVDGAEYRVRCPKELEPGSHDVLFEGVATGSVQVY